MPVTLLKSEWSSGNLVFKQTVSTGDAAVHFGEDDTGVDVKMFGATSGSYALWDQSADDLVLASAQVNFLGAGQNAPFNFDGSNTYFADFAAAGVAGLSLTADGMSQDPETASEDGWLEVLVGASKYQIPMYLNT